MNILHVIRDLSPSTGGPVTALKELARAQAAAGHDVVVAATDFGIDLPPSIEGVDVHVFSCTSGAWRWSRAMADKLPSLVKHADIVHIHTLWEFPTWAAARICRNLKRHYIIRPCGMLDAWSMSQRGLKKRLYLRLVLGSAFSNASALHFTTDGELAKSVAVDGVRGRFVSPIGVPLPAADIPRGHFKAGLGIPDSSPVVLFLGRIHYKKQPDLLIKAFSRVVPASPGAHLVFAGPVEPAYRAELQALVESLGLLDRVEWAGPLDRNRVYEAYAAADLFVLPSLQENFGISVAEAMASGCPVIVSGNVDLAADISSFGAGIVCGIDVDSVAAGMSRLLSDPAERREAGDNGRRLIREKFSPAAITCELDHLYNDILENRMTSPSWRN